MKRVPNVGTAEGIQASAAYHRREAERRSKFKSQRGMKQALRWADQMDEAGELVAPFWAEVERLTEASGIEAAKMREQETRDALSAHVTAIMRQESRTLAGVVVKTQGLAAWGEAAPPFWKVMNPEGAGWAATLADHVLLVGGAAA